MAFNPRNINPPRYRNEEEIGTGTVTSISAGTGITLTPSPIIGTGSVALETLDPDPSGTYGDATNVSQITVDAQGRVTAAADVPVGLEYYYVAPVQAQQSFDSLAADTDADITGLSLSVGAGTYHIGYSLSFGTDCSNFGWNAKVTNSSNVVFAGSTAYVKLYQVTSNVSDRFNSTCHHSFFVTLAAADTIKVRAAKVNAPTELLRFYFGAIDAGLTDPDGNSNFWAIKIA